MRRATARHISDTCSFDRLSSRPPLSLLFSRGARPSIWVPAPARYSSTKNSSTKPSAAPARRSVVPPPPPPGITELADAVQARRKKLLSNDGIPPLQETIDALYLCRKAANALHVKLENAEAQFRASASRLALLGAERTGSQLPMDAKLQEAVNTVSYAAYTIITNPKIEMRADLLGLYVQIQHQLGRPESLPTVLRLYAAKPKPVDKDGKVQLVRQNPNSPSKAVEVDAADLALRTAIEAKHLDSALGIIEASYCTKAFKRQKLLKHATPPFIALATLPFSIYGLSTAYALYCQNTMDVMTATAICCVGITGYFLSVGSLGMIAKLSYKEQMRRVTWTPGTPLRYRWLREEERAALDAVACAWGFKEEFRHGEETGADWEGLKEYMGYRQMLLDRVEFMRGMS
ncbi:hypothetical protein L249_3489 [Ophiocordyceps polyrhachis-furcata BCC 54312]|uniref:Uncharacterized protein n=1 Tax=Ophiocordyceps polyrhachis-furcata BCC 54312 TaxID=1330021 RepID=A0A367LMN8_9HYPO|nr:hypothetical protein L249_3489 [Ophiocordyceps polyrhachis-furcata BCC 54312]